MLRECLVLSLQWAVLWCTHINDFIRWVDVWWSALLACWTKGRHSVPCYTSDPFLCFTITKTSITFYTMNLVKALSLYKCIFNKAHSELCVGIQQALKHASRRSIHRIFQTHDSFGIDFLSWWSHKDHTAWGIIIGCLHNQITSGNCPDDHYATDWFCYLVMCKRDLPLHYLPVEKRWHYKLVCGKVLGNISSIIRYLSLLFRRTKESYTVRSQARISPIMPLYQAN